MWRTHKKSVWVLCGWYAVYLGLAAVAVFFGWSDKPEMRKYCLIFLGVSVPGVVMSFFIESYRALFIAAGLGRLSIAIELCSFGVCFVCIWFTAFYMGYGFYGIKFSNTVVHVFSLGCYMSFWYKSEFFEAWRAGEKNSSAQEIPMGQGNADSSIYITNKFKPRVWPGPDPSEYFFVILIKKKTKQDPQLQKPNSRAPPGRAAPQHFRYLKILTYHRFQPHPKPLPHFLINPLNPLRLLQILLLFHPPHLNPHPLVRPLQPPPLLRLLHLLHRGPIHNHSPIHCLKLLLLRLQHLNHLLPLHLPIPTPPQPPGIQTTGPLRPPIDFYHHLPPRQPLLPICREAC